jgi:hypothetical protein
VKDNGQEIISRGKFTDKMKEDKSLWPRWIGLNLCYKKENKVYKHVKVEKKTKVKEFRISTKREIVKGG